MTQPSMDISMLINNEKTPQIDGEFFKIDSLFEQ